MFLEWSKEHPQMKVQISNLIHELTEQINEVFKGIQLRNMPVEVSGEAEFQAFAGRGIYTMSHQSVRMGIPALQIEFPLSVRRLLVKEDNLMKSLAEVIVQLYNKYIKIWGTKGAKACCSELH